MLNNPKLSSKIRDIFSLRTLIIDNYDSYTFNLLQLWENEKSTENVVVIRNNQFSWNDFKENILPYFDNIIISPGPGRPETPSDFGICANIIKELNDVPILGVCLGHQGIGVAFDCQMENAKTIMHGRLSPIYHEGTYNPMSLYYGIPSPFWAVRYHSLMVKNENISPELTISAWCSEDSSISIPPLKESSTIMGLNHINKPIYGVQFHPESICTENGYQLLRNFLTISKVFLEKHGITFPRTKLPLHILSHSVLSKNSRVFRPLTSKSATEATEYCLILKKLKRGLWIDSSLVFQHIVATDKSTVGTWWLDSARQPDRELSIFSDGSVINKKMADNQTFWDWMSETINHFNQRMGSLRILRDDGTLQDVKEQKIPFDFRLGMVGYFGYEMKRESLPNYTISTGQYPIPDSAFIFTTQAIIFDHLEMQVWLAGLVRLEDKIEVDYVDNNLGMRPGLLYADYLSWTMSTEEQLHSLVSSSTPLKQDIQNEEVPFSVQIPFTSDMKPDAYIRAIEKARSYIYEGQSYELCLTTQFRASLPKRSDDNWVELYQCIRSFNPAPFSALLSFPTKDICIMSSSPEKFLQIDNEGVIEMKPIKGTIARARGCCCLNLKKCDKGTLCEFKRKEEDMRRMRLLEGDIKERSENLMIVDLIRNDLTQICQPTTVQVPYLMKVESYETVHQLVTTVRGQLREDLDCVKAIRECFPPGSMTGAPKLRSVQLLDELEQNKPRGVYSGCLGYISLQDGSGKRGTSQFNVVIRTAIIRFGMGEVTVGAGGAIVYLSNAESEWDEVELKSQSVIPSILEYMNKLV
ncbi:aminodeoxychorismate synthase component I [Rhizophagus clarus]|uniref:aminodeoxychorismate synthase n=1 Tax=Rhizophagus clarus TaxID=94130 RepID=A0A8H3QYL2_9GLOM|nr:aminodeoxychorismate synthase component I [Rhizophagus clarus]